MYVTFNFITRIPGLVVDQVELHLLHSINAFWLHYLNVMHITIDPGIVKMNRCKT